MLINIDFDGTQNHKQTKKESYEVHYSNFVYDIHYWVKSSFWQSFMSDYIKLIG